jgi:hypothetical protein
MFIRVFFEAWLLAILIFGFFSWLPIFVPLAIYIHIALNRGIDNAWDLYQRTKNVLQLETQMNDKILSLQKRVEELEMEKAAILQNQALLLDEIEDLAEETSYITQGLVARQNAFEDFDW